MTDPQNNRRPLAVRNKAWAQAFARRLSQTGVSPNAVSLASMVFALCGALALLWSIDSTGLAQRGAYLFTALMIQMRLLCNLFDGMVAIEGQKFTRSGELFNDVPDRVSDVLLIVALGYALPSVPYASQLAWLAAVLAVMTAYVRVLGAASGLAAEFLGPMAKQHRMAVMTVALICSAIWLELATWLLSIALLLILIGSALTCIRRLYKIYQLLEK